MSSLSAAILIVILCVIHSLHKTNCIDLEEKANELPSSSGSSLIRTIRTADFPGVGVKTPLCGNRLVEAVRLVCRGLFMTTRRSSSSVYNDGFEPEQTEPSSIVEECCRRGCNLRSLTKYCDKGILETLISITTTTPAPQLPKPAIPFEIFKAMIDFIANSRARSTNTNGHKANVRPPTQEAFSAADAEEKYSIRTSRVDDPSTGISKGERQRQRIPESNIYRDAENQYDQRSYFTEGF